MPCNSPEAPPRKIISQGKPSVSASPAVTPSLPGSFGVTLDLPYDYSQGRLSVRAKLHCSKRGTLITQEERYGIHIVRIYMLKMKHI